MRVVHVQEHGEFEEIFKSQSPSPVRDVPDPFVLSF